MIYVQFHLGDWSSNTRLLSVLEKGAYIDLLSIYYASEAPLVRSKYERITARCTDEERAAYDYVLSEFFEEREDGYHNESADQAIAESRAKSERARASISARWAKKAEKKESADTNEIRSNYERTTNVLLTNNLITNNQEIKENKKRKPADAGAAPSAAPRSRSKKFEPEELRTGQIDRQLFADWLAVRKAKRAPLTETAWAQIKREAGKAGLDLNAVLRLMVEHSWQGISADWDAVQAAAGKAPAPAQQARSISAFSQPVELLPTDAERHAWDAKIQGDQQGRDPVAWARQTLAAPVGPWIASKARAVLAKRGLAA